MTKTTPKSMKKHSSSSNSPGFTLMEVVAVLVILGVLATLAIPRISGLQSSMDVQEVRDQLIGDLRQARSMAQACAGTSVEVSSNSNGWSVEPSSSCGHSISRSTDVSIDSFEVIFEYPDGNLSGAGGEVALGVCVDASTGSISRCN